MSLTMTTRAAEHVKKFLAGQAYEGLRIAVKTTGCSGFAYVVEPTEEITEQDNVFESCGIRLIVDSKSLAHLSGTELDYTREGLNEGFKFNNPNVKETCGCGESFTV